MIFDLNARQKSSINYISSRYTERLMRLLWRFKMELQSHGLMCIAGAAGMFIYGLGCLEKVDSLKKSTRIKNLRDLSRLLQNSSTESPLIVSITGKVSSDRPPIMCESGGLQCVILEEKTEKHKIVTKDKSNGDCKNGPYYIQKSHNIRTVHKEVPWYLDDGTGWVYVVGAQCALHWETSVLCGEAYKSQSSSIRGTRDNFSEGMDLVVKTTRPILTVGTPLTVIGEAIKDAAGRIQIRQPTKGPFYVSRYDFDKIIAPLEEPGVTALFCSVVTGLVGFLLLGAAGVADSK